MYTYMFLGVFKDKIKFMYTDFLNVLIFFLASVQENFLIPLMPHVSDFPKAATRGQHTHIYEASILTNKASAKSGWVWLVAAQGLFQWIAIVVAVTFKGLGKKDLLLCWPENWDSTAKREKGHYIHMGWNAIHVIFVFASDS